MWCIKHRQETTISFPVSGHSIIKRLQYRTKRALFFFESQHWSAWLDTALYTKVCPALSHVSVKFISPMNFWSKGLSNTINTIRKKTITTFWSWNSHYWKGHQTISASKGLTRDSADICQAFVWGKVLLPCVWGCSKGKFHSHTHSPTTWKISNAVRNHSSWLH